MGLVSRSCRFAGTSAAARAGAAGAASGGGGGMGWVDIFKGLKHGALNVCGIAGGFFFTEWVGGRRRGEEGVHEKR